ncbi:hypothetical protein A7J57_00130 [Agrobacterium tumefaciens]|uniref:Uncharacterized protein n=2 Tax=Agrobacterium tumefaciens TaxID=358 RepID=A0A176XAA5_AGRTU|nr:hypothetical protein A7J57_00130 [Agrobacterium tumefaciens]
MQKIAHGEMCEAEVANWKMKRVREIRRDAVKDRLRLKYLPFDPTPETVADAEAFLLLSDAEQAHELEFAYNERAEFLICLMTARALYVDPLDRRDGSITQAKVDRHPERN